MVQNISKKGSWDGYDIMTALVRNKDSLKVILSVLSTYSAYATVTGVDWREFLIVFGFAVGTLAFKLLLDAIEFRQTNVKL